jgi:hypothetical protein
MIVVQALGAIGPDAIDAVPAIQIFCETHPHAKAACDKTVRDIQAKVSTIKKSSNPGATKIGSQSSPDERALEFLDKARAARKGGSLRNAERYYKFAVEFSAQSKHNSAFTMLILSEYKTLLEERGNAEDANQIQLRIAELQRSGNNSTLPAARGCGVAPTVLDERYMRTGRSERTFALPGTLPADAPISD